MLVTNVIISLNCSPLLEGMNVLDIKVKTMLMTGVDTVQLMGGGEIVGKQGYPPNFDNFKLKQSIHLSLSPYFGAF